MLHVSKLIDLALLTAIQISRLQIHYYSALSIRCKPNPKRIVVRPGRNLLLYSQNPERLARAGGLSIRISRDILDRMVLSFWTALSNKNGGGREKLRLLTCPNFSKLPCPMYNAHGVVGRSLPYLDYFYNCKILTWLLYSAAM